MKRMIAPLLALLIVASAFTLAACQKQESVPSEKTTVSAETVNLDGLTPYATTNEGKATGYYKNEYDAQKRLVRNYSYNSDGKLMGSTGYEYDANGHENHEIMYDVNGQVIAQILLENTEKGFPTKRTELDASGAVTRLYTTTYNEKGFEAEQCEYDGKNNLVQRIVYEYDDKDNLVKQTTYEAGDKIKSYITYVVNDDGSFTTYKYDGDGNLISKE